MSMNGLIADSLWIYGLAAAVSLLMIHLKKGGFKGFAVAQVQA